MLILEPPQERQVIRFGDDHRVDLECGIETRMKEGRAERAIDGQLVRFDLDLVGEAEGRRPLGSEDENLAVVLRVS